MQTADTIIPHMKLGNKKKKGFLKKDCVVTAVLIIIVVITGYFVFQSWQNSMKVIESSGSFEEVQFPKLENSQPQRTPIATAEPDYLWIPARGIETPVIYITQEQNTEEGHQDALAKGIVHYPGTARPGEFGNPYIFGHSSDYLWKEGDYKQIFKELIDIPVGTEVRITNSDGELFIYNVIETKIVGPKEVSVMDQHNYERQLLTLQTSWPLGTALKRYIAVCELAEETTYGVAESNP